MSTAFSASTHVRLVLPLVGVLFALAVAIPVVGQSSHDRYRVEAVRVDIGPVIDGVLDEQVWASAAVITDFVQQEPNEGAPASDRTEVRLIYDGRSLFVGVHAYSSDPGAVTATEMRLDSDRILDEDNFQIILDTFMDSRSGYMFVTNPLGAKLDQQVSEEGEGGRRGASSNINRDWDGIWDVVARRTDDGWVAEIAIPVVTLRFPNSASQDWGINFMRNISARNEQSYWAPITKGYSISRVSMAGSLTGLHTLNRGRDLKITPFVAGGGRMLSDAGVRDEDFQRDAGIDMKYGITAGLTLDLTVNTDFAQAEVDDERVNLTRFALFYPEKRDFFLENAGQFNVGTLASNDRIADLFFTRQIGISSGQQVPIVGGARLTGKVGANNIAIMDVQTDDAFDRSGENFLVARYSRDILGRSKVGGLVVNKQAIKGGHFNRTFAADMVLALTPSITVNGFLARTASPDVDDQQMGAHLRAGLLNPSWNLYAEFTDLQDNFNAEVGFVPRVGIRTSKLHVERNPRPGRFGIRLMEPMVNVTYTTDQEDRLVSRQWHYMLGTRFDNGASIIIWHNRYFERLDEPFRVQGVLIDPGAYHFWDSRISLSSNRANRFYASVGYSPQTYWGGDRTDTSLTLGFRVNSRLSTEGGLSRNEVDLPAGAFTSNIGSLRVDYAISPTMTLRTLSQYNSLTEQWSTSARFHYIYRPGSDFYVVYDELRRDPTGLSEYRQRNLILKMTYLLSR